MFRSCRTRYHTAANNDAAAKNHDNDDDFARRCVPHDPDAWMHER